MTRIQEITWIEDVHPAIKADQVGRERITSRRINLYSIPWLRRVLESRWPQFAVRLITLSGFIFTILSALLGSRVGSHNFAIIMVWIAWWTTLKLGFIPLGGRSWCSVCPIALPGEWMQQGGILRPSKKPFGLNKRWPKFLRGSWLQSGGFLLIGMFSAVTLTDPRVTGWVLLGLFALAAVMPLIFEHRAFCSYICPIGGFSGMYSKAAPVEIKVIDKAVCASHGEKTCYQACPWGLYPVALKESAACGLCMECLRACPKDNLALNLRPYGADLTDAGKHPRLDETWLALIMLGSALAFSAVFLGPWGWLKTSAFEVGSKGWLVYVASFLLLNLLVLPAAFSLCAWVYKIIGRSTRPLKTIIAQLTNGLLPLGLLAWIAFTVSFALPKLRNILGVLNDPFGWGWHWLNLAVISSPGDVSGISAYLVALLLVVGVAWSARVTQKTSITEGGSRRMSNYPVLAFHLAYSISLLWLLVG